MDDLALVYEAIYYAIIADPRYQRNIDWGKPRRGHPEGTIRAHIAELESNLDILKSKLVDTDIWKLRLLIHTHDTFKAETTPLLPIADPSSHASLARTFLAEFCLDEDLLAMVQHHDEPYALWLQYKSKGEYDQGRMNALIGNIENWNLFLAFLIIDGCTRGKSRKPLQWMFTKCKDMGGIRFH